MRKIGIIGTGSIANKMATTVTNMRGYELYAVASRTIEKAESFAAKYNINKAYGSYNQLVEDPEVELVYIATPHGLHYKHTKLCLEHNKAVLCEKAFMANAKEAEEIFNLAQSRNIFITEAIWTRFMPLSLKIIELANSGIIGRIHTLSANLSYNIAHKERIQKAELAGGALLDIGIYCLNFAAMLFGTDIQKTVSSCTKTESGMDAQETITQYFSDDRMAVLYSSIYSRSDRKGILCGDKGYMVVENINNPESVRIYNTNDELIAEYLAPKQITGYEYQVIASFEAIDNGKIETPFMPHKESLRIMQMMDNLRREWGVVYPNDL